MSESSERLERARVNLEVALENATARLAELDSVSVTERARMTYTEGQQTYDWNGYRAALIQQIMQMRESQANIAALAWNEVGCVRSVVR